MTTSAELGQLLFDTLQGHVPLDQLFAAIDAAIEREPATAAEFMQTVEGLYARNEIRYDVYLIIKDRCAARTRPPAAFRGAGVSVTRPPAMAPADDGRTQLRPVADPPRPAAPDGGDRTVLRPPTQPPPHPARGFGAVPAQRSVPPPIPTVSPAHSGPRLTAPDTRAASGDDASWTLTTEQPLEPGSLIKGRFLLDQRVGAGGMGVVFKARDLRKEEAQDRDPYVAIKFLNPDFRRHPEALKALQRETRRAQSLAHPNVVTVHDFDRDGTLIYMTMEFLTGEPLDAFIQRHPQGLRFNEAWPVIEGAGRALMYAHEQGVIHADFKPGNVFVSDRKAKVLDFGIARAVKAQGNAAEGTRFDAGTLGALTPAYASPEMLLNGEPDPRDDVYALACVAYELMTGKHPFHGVPAVKAAHDGMKVKRIKGMGRYQYKALLHGLAFRQTERTPTIESFLDEIAGPFGVRGRAVRSAVLSMASTAILVGGIGFALWYFTRPDPDKQLERRLEESAVAQLEQSRSGGAAPGEIDPELLKVLLEQGNDYLDMARKSFDAGILSEGVSSALGAFQEVLRVDPKNKQAIAGIVEVVHLYETEIGRLATAGDDARVVQLAGFARRIDPNRTSLEDFERAARANLDPAAAAQKQ